MLSTVFFSCSTEENTISVENTTSLSEQNSFLKQSDEIIAFREVLAEFSRSNTLKRKNGKPVSIFNSTNQEQISNQARMLLNTFGSLGGTASLHVMDPVSGAAVPDGETYIVIIV
ncbi:hypothetical protein ACFSQP_05335 [Bizionia sediminis]|uniref:Uncharacterized protein n=1 Tax=Bizionia sediminis TaxID=1737064 RepID=A0ABW5KSL3_9FLAO